MNFAFLFNNFFELTITGLALGAIYALVALGYTMVYGVLQLINFAHSEVFMFGTFAVAWVVVFIHGTDLRHAGSRADPGHPGDRLRRGHAGVRGDRRRWSNVSPTAR